MTLGTVLGEVEVGGGPAVHGASDRAPASPPRAGSVPIKITITIRAMAAGSGFEVRGVEGGGWSV